MTFRLFDAGSLERSSSAKNADCQVRAFATATGRKYKDAWELLYFVQGEKRGCGFLLVESLNEADPRFNVIRKLSFKAKKGEERMTGKKFCERYKKGRFILRMANHVAAVKDGVLFDTSNSSFACVYCAWEVSSIS